MIELVEQMKEVQVLVKRDEHHSPAFGQIVTRMIVYGANILPLTLGPWRDALLVAPREFDAACNLLWSTSSDTLDLLTCLCLNASVARALIVPWACMRIVPPIQFGSAFMTQMNSVMESLLDSCTTGEWDKRADGAHQLLLNSVVYTGKDLMLWLGTDSRRETVPSMLSQKLFQRLFRLTCMSLSSHSQPPLEQYFLASCFSLVTCSVGWEENNSEGHVSSGARASVFCSELVDLCRLLVQAFSVLEATRSEDDMRILMISCIVISQEDNFPASTEVNQADYMHAVRRILDRHPVAELQDVRPCLVVPVINQPPANLRDCMACLSSAYHILNVFITHSVDSNTSESTSMAELWTQLLVKMSNRCGRDKAHLGKVKLQKLLCDLSYMPGPIYQLESYLRSSHARGSLPVVVTVLQLQYLLDGRRAAINKETLTAQTSLFSTVRKVCITGTVTASKACKVWKISMNNMILLEAWRQHLSHFPRHTQEMQLHLAGIIVDACNVPGSLVESDRLEMRQGVKTLMSPMMGIQKVMLRLLDGKIRTRQQQAQVWEAFLARGTMRWPRVKRCSNWLCLNVNGRCDAALATALCEGCKRVRYCSVECQRMSWVNGHNHLCATLSA